MSWESWEKTSNKGPAALAWRIFGFGLCALVVLGTVAYFCGWIGETAKVAQDEFGPKAALKKYETLKDMAAALTAKKKDLEVLDAQLESIRTANGNKPRSEWPRDERQNYQQREAELVGLKMSYNNLAAEYNATSPPGRRCVRALHVQVSNLVSLSTIHTKRFNHASSEFRPCVADSGLEAARSGSGFCRGGVCRLGLHRLWQ
jgi:hypothetical protein